MSAAALARCDPARTVETRGGAALGTRWSVRIVLAQGASAEHLHDAIEVRLGRIVAEMSQWEPGSHLSRFNRAPAGAWITLPPDFDTVLRCALTIAERSAGAFDPSLGRTAALLGYGAQAIARPPSAAELDAAHATAGWRRLDHDPQGRRLRQPGGMWLDLSGIAKGFAVDAVAALLREAGVEDALVEIGGELAGTGLKPDGQPWWVDVEAPPDCVVAPLRVALHGQAIATSGDYVRGRHTLDPASGRPLAPRVRSVSVIHDSAMLADAWATALTVLGPERGMALAAREQLAARMIVREDGATRERLSPALQAMIDA